MNFNEKTNSIYTHVTVIASSIHVMYISHVSNLLHDDYICSGNFQAMYKYSTPEIERSNTKRVKCSQGNLIHDSHPLKTTHNAIVWMIHNHVGTACQLPL